ncbi:hypothetical protein Bhyg_14567, partial [Pseudolycoriella hygida]
VVGDNYITAATTVQSSRVINALQTVDTINGINLTNVASLHEDIYLHSPLTFRMVKVQSINTKDTISGINFDYWHANALWKSQRENQIVSGTWTVSEGIFHSSIRGEAELNGIPMDTLAGQINSHQSNVLNNLQIFNEGYVENCRKMTRLIQSTHTLPYFLSHFEETFSLRVQNVINSVHLFEANSQSYLVLNLGCLTVVYIWNRGIESYEKLIEVETGNVDSWLDMMDEANVVHLISNTEVDRSNCPTSGLNIWKFDGSSLVHVSKIADSNKFALLHKNKLHPQRFLAMAKDGNVVNAFDLENNLLEQWHLPVNEQQFRFVPENANIGIALSNGKQLSSLSFNKLTDNRKERSTISDEVANELTEIKRMVRCPFLTEQIQNATANCKLWYESRLQLPSNSRYKETDRPTPKRLMKDIKISNSQVGSPFILTAPLLERKTRIKSDLFNLSRNGQSIHTDGIELMTSAARGQPVNKNESSARDAFGKLEKNTIDLTDDILDSWIELEADNEDIYFDDSNVGSSSRNESGIESESSVRSGNHSQSKTSTDWFEVVANKTTQLADEVADVVENIKNSAKESEAKLRDLFKPVNNDPYRKSEVKTGIDEIENTNLPKIPKVVYTSNDTILHATQSLEPTASTEYSTTANIYDDDVGEKEPKIGNEISSEGIATAENQNFPNHAAEEILVIPAGENRKHLVAVSSLRKHTIEGKHDLIRIYEDIIEGNLFQTLVCHGPRSLTVLNIRDEAILAFIENDASIQIFVYRGIQGFVQFTSFEFSSVIFKLTSIHLPVANVFACAKSYLAVVMKKEIRFIEAKTCGYCGINAQLACN